MICPRIITFTVKRFLKCHFSFFFLSYLALMLQVSGGDLVPGWFYLQSLTPPPNYLSSSHTLLFQTEIEREREG